MSRALLGDMLLALTAIALIVIGSGIAAVRQVPPRHPLDVPAYVLMVIAAAALLVRRPRPLATLAGAVAAAVPSPRVRNPVWPRPPTLLDATFRGGPAFPP